MQGSSFPEMIINARKIRNECEAKFNTALAEKGRSETLDDFWPVDDATGWIIGFDIVKWCETMFENFMEKEESGEELTKEMFGEEFTEMLRKMY